MANQPLKWDVDPVMFTLSIEWYFIWTLICVIFGYFFLSGSIKDGKRTETQNNLTVIFTLFVVMIGGRLGYGLLAQPDLFFQSPFDYFVNWIWRLDFKFQRPLRWYGLLFASSFIIGSLIGSWIFQREGKPREKMDRLILFLAIGTVVGARLGHCIFYNPQYYFSNPVRILKIWEGGLASHGAGIGLLLAVLYYSRTTKGFTFFWVFDRLTIVIAIAGSFIRLGNLMNSEILGTRTNSALGVIFERVDSVPRHPVQIYESVTYFIIFLVLLGLYVRKGSRTTPGVLTGTAFILGFVARFIIEFVKEKQISAGSEMIFNMGQWLSIPMILFGIFILQRSLRGVKK